MAIYSCTKMAEMLNKTGFLPEEITADDLRQKCESYGRKVHCYLKLKDRVDRLRVEQWMKKQKINYDKDYWPESSYVSFRVTYFKAPR